MKSFDISKVIFFLLIIFLPQQFGPHFWPRFSYVNGIRLDYLSPSIYVSDVLMLLLIVFSARNFFHSQRILSFLGNKLFFLFLLIVTIPILYASQPLAIFFGFLKLFEFIYLGLYTATFLSKKDIWTLIEILTVTAVLESVLAIGQFIKQGSINGLLYFAGERIYSLSTPGIAAMDTPHGLIVRPYGTFPHPNVLSFFLFVSAVFATYAMHYSKKVKRYLYLLSIVIMEAGLFITFSRTVLFLNIIFLLYAFGYISLKNSKRKIQGILFIVFLLASYTVYTFLNPNRFMSFAGIIHDYVPRADLFTIGLSAFFSSPLFGLGLNNFYYYETSVQTNFSSIYLQPVHNIFLLIAVSVGLLGLFIFGYFLTVGLLKNISRVKKEKGIFSFSEIPLILFLSVIFVGLFDHFLITVQQGELFLAIILGLSFSSLWSRSR